MSDTPTQFSTFFDQSELDLPTFERYADVVYASARDREQFDSMVNAYRERVDRGEGSKLTLALALFILNRFSESLDVFAQAGRSKARYYFGALAEAAAGRYGDAIKHFEAAAGAGWDAFEAEVQAALAHLRAGDIDAAEKIARKNERSGSDRADWYYLKGEIAERRNEREAAAGFYEKARQLDPDHAGAMFRLAWLADLAGDDQTAITLYEKLATRPRTYVNALMNLAVLYEDRGDYAFAGAALRRVLAAFPNHPRARLFLKDVESSREMVIDEGLEKRAETRNRLLETPIGEFELSVRARNCLKKMNIRSLGDLLRLSEPELLSYKNFGETSLTEIKALLTKRGLKLGQKPDEIDMTLVEPPPPPQPKVSVPAGSEGILAKPVSEMELSVRARRCLQRLSIASIGDLIQHTEADLLATRNFGVTSLNEIKGRLHEMGLQLAPRP